MSVYLGIAVHFELCRYRMNQYYHHLYRQTICDLPKKNIGTESHVSKQKTQQFRKRTCEAISGISGMHVTDISSRYRHQQKKK